MKALLAVGLRLRHGGVTTALSVVAFAVTTAFALSVLGGVHGFVGRVQDPPPGTADGDAPFYVMLALVAAALLLAPLTSLAGAAARLGVARRDARLATLRLLGVTSREVVAITAAETAAQGLAGVVLGVAGYGALLGVWTRVPFQGHAFSVAELWVGFGPLLATLGAVPVIGAVSAVVSLRRVVISPLGVARRQAPPALKGVRALGLLGAVAAFSVATQALAGLAVAVVVGVLLVALLAVTATVQLVGPWLIGVLGRTMARRARTPATLLAARRLLDDPRGAWRVVGGLGLASLVAAALSVIPVLGATGTADDQLVLDLRTGGLVTLGIAVALAAVSAGIAQAAGVLDRRREYALQKLAGVPVELFDTVRRREVLAPTAAVVALGAATGWGLLLPLFGMAAATQPLSLVLLAGVLVAGVVTVVAATETSRPMLAAVLRETVVRAD